MELLDNYYYRPEQYISEMVSLSSALWFGGSKLFGAGYWSRRSDDRLKYNQLCLRDQSYIKFLANEKILYENNKNRDMDF